jgi:hypothetical protein
MSYNLRRIPDGVGDCGSRSEAISWDGNESKVVGSEPQIGCAMLVGSLIAGTYSRQDWWMTTQVQEILEEIKEDNVHYVRFKTNNSTYEWWIGEYPKKYKWWEE